MPVVRLLLSILFAAGLTGTATAQLRSNRPNRPTANLPRLMTANPYAANSADSAAAVRVGEGMRKRMEDIAGRWFTVITRDQMNEALLQYAYPADAVLPPTVARTLATQLQARFLVTSTLARTEGGRYSVQVRAAGMNDKAGYTATLSQPPNTTPEDFGKAAADALTNNFKAYEEARKCWDTQTAKPAERGRLREQGAQGPAQPGSGRVLPGRDRRDAQGAARHPDRALQERDRGRSAVTRCLVQAQG